jgi:hypothetical protein
LDLEKRQTMNHDCITPLFIIFQIQSFQSFETTIQQIIKLQQKNSFDKYDISMNVFIHLNYPVVEGV